MLLRNTNSVTEKSSAQGLESHAAQQQRLADFLGVPVLRSNQRFADA